MSDTKERLSISTVFRIDRAVPAGRNQGSVHFGERNKEVGTVCGHGDF